MNVAVKFISIWNDGFEIETAAELNTNTGEICNIQSYSGELVDADGDELEILEGQYIEFNGKRFMVEEVGSKYIASITK
ncbi:hypothetical protein [Shouchella clausii]|uniref:hypothetical protein n=1 Tax=Shouchella clausii TaxID=79880 RepID=UPI001C72F921|nr:hypothetical protein [Shouchella clausii]MBX0320150.1 hypothetical protein [Shouchella clausii]MEB5480836.1 hypothetical protein [Shouchella clausii]